MQRRVDRAGDAATPRTPSAGRLPAFWSLCAGVALLLLGATHVRPVLGGCRDQERVACETVCGAYDAATGRHGPCTIRAAVILPNDTRLEASLQRVSERVGAILSIFSAKLSVFMIINRTKNRN